jgi:hypothetical protein
MTKLPSTIRDARKRGWFILDNELIDRYGKTIGATGLAVYGVLARYANYETGIARPAYQTIADSLGMSRNTVIVAIRKLEASGLVTIEQQTDGAGNPIKSNIYTLCTIERGAEIAPPPGAEFEPLGVQNLDGGVQELNPGGANSAYEVDSRDNTSITPPPPEPPTQTQPQQIGGGGGEDMSYEQELRKVLGGFGILAARKIAGQYAVMEQPPAIAIVRTAIEGLIDPREPHNLDRIARRLMDCPPPYTTPTARAPNGRAIPPPTKIDRPPDAMSSQQTASNLSALLAARGADRDTS